MTESEIKAVLMTAQSTLRSKSKFALFCVELSEELYGVVGVEVPEGDGPLVARIPEIQTEFDLFWKLTVPFRQIQS